MNPMEDLGQMPAEADETTDAEQIAEELMSAREAYEDAVHREHYAMANLTQAQSAAALAAGDVLKTHNAYQVALRAAAAGTLPPHVHPRPRRAFRDSGAPTGVLADLLPTETLKRINTAAERADNG